MDLKEKKPIVISIILLAILLLAGWLVIKFLYIDLPGIQYGKGHQINSLLKEDNQSVNFSKKQVPLGSLAEILWAGYGRISSSKRTVLSLADYPFTLYIYTGAETVTDLKTGLYEYKVNAHDLKIKARKDISAELNKALKIGQTAPFLLFLACDQELYRAKKFETSMEAGEILSNILLKSKELKMKVNLITEFNKSAAIDALEINDQTLLWTIAAGY